MRVCLRLQIAFLRVGEGSSVLGIRVGVPHLAKFDVGGVQRWRGVRH